MHTITNKILKEFELLPSFFEVMANSILDNNELTKVYSKFNLYEIEPFYAELSNDVIDLNQDLFLASAEDFDHDSDDLYEYFINFDSQKTYFKRWIFGPESRYETIFEYKEEYHKSTTTFINTNGSKATKLCYLYFKEGVPHQYFECTEYGIIEKTYQKEGNRLTGYKIESPDNGNRLVDFKYNESEIAKIIQKNPLGPDTLLYEAGLDKKNKADILKKLENFLTEQIADQIEQNVKIKEPVYCILLEYSMQFPFPPTVALGLVSELEDDFEKVEIWQRYNAPDMHYFSEGENLSIDIYTETIQSAYLFCDNYTENIQWDDEEAHKAWAEEVFEIYLNICKRLMHFNFSSSFPKSPHFLVMAREFEQCNDEKFYELLSEYKKDIGK
ncbi:hypothetical protein ABWH96_16055 [Marivirga tractuosa]|uniref:hypothetical protein n=1 Tax=Marivirga tractuosa TaxID=1006 RepID=UPI0035CF6E90